MCRGLLVAAIEGHLQHGLISGASPLHDDSDVATCFGGGGQLLFIYGCRTCRKRLFFADDLVMIKPVNRLPSGNSGGGEGGTGRAIFYILTTVFIMHNKPPNGAMNIASNARLIRVTAFLQFDALPFAR